ncbi:MAG: sigma-70 family RNA polymerase sigma factor [Treponemataceae bacterium]|nr:sigma-70 family RNA polymerase sigma factor [Treponemataceae bacterium]
MNEETCFVNAISAEYPVLSAEEQMNLAVSASKGNRDARDKLILSNIKYVAKSAQVFFRHYANECLSVDDLVMEGICGLSHAIDKFNEESGVNFLTYAKHWIDHYMFNSVYNEGRMVRIPKNKVTKTNGIRVDSLDCEVTQNNGTDKGIAFGEKICDERENTEANCEKNVLSETLAEMIDQLDERSAGVLVRHYGLDGKGCKSFAKIGVEMGMSAQNVCHLHKKAMIKFCSSENLKRLKDFHAA